MDISATSYRILKYLSTLRNDAFPDKNHIIQTLGFTNRNEFDNSISDLKRKQLLGGGMTNVYIEPAGRNYISSIEQENNKIAHETVFSNFDFAVIEFLYNNPWGVHEDEFPVIIKEKCPEDIFSDYLYQKSSFIKHSSNEYTLKTAGIEYYINEKEKVQPTSLPAIFKIDKSVKIGDGFSGVFAQDSDLSNALISPTTENKNNSNPAKPTKRSVLEIMAWIIGIAAGAVAIYEFIIKK